MTFLSRSSWPIFLFLHLQRLFPSIVAQNVTGTLPSFEDTVQISGNMERTDQGFADGLALDLFSPKARTLLVKQNTSPLPAEYVTGATGSPFVALSNYSYIIQMNETANDLIAKVQLPYDPAMLSRMGIPEANTYVGTLAADNQSWVIDETIRNVHGSENSTRLMKMTSLDGEYMLLGRRTADTGNIFVQYGQGETRTVNMTGGPGIQENEFVDGFRFSVQTNKDLKMNVILKQGVNPGTLPDSAKSLNSFMWIVNTSDPFMKVDAQMLIPFNRNMLVALKPEGSSPSTMLVVAKRALNATSGQFMPVCPDTQVVRELPEDRILIPSATQLDGQYIILVTEPKAVGQTPAQITAKVDPSAQQD